MGLDDEHIAKLKEASPYYEEYTTPREPMRAVPETKTVAVSAVVVVRDDVSEEVCTTSFTPSSKIWTTLPSLTTRAKS